MTRLVSGVALAAAALVAIRFLPLLPLRVLACLVAALAAKEYLDIVDSPIRAVVLVIALCWVARLSHTATSPGSKTRFAGAGPRETWRCGTIGPPSTTRSTTTGINPGSCAA